MRRVSFADPVWLGGIDPIFADGFFFTRCGESCKKCNGMDAFNNGLKHIFGHISDEINVMRFERRKYNFIPSDVLLYL